jgi:hypothetical protein
MMRRKRVILIGLVLVVLLSVGLVGGLALAQTTDAGDSPGTTLMSRVAAILGIEQSKVEAAFNQAQSEMELEALDNRLKAMVEEGKITQEQADQYKAWWQSKPEMPAGVGLSGSGGYHGMRGHGGPGGMIPPPSTSADDGSPTTTP